VPLDELETRKDIAQEIVETGLGHVSQIMGIIVGAAQDVTRELGDWATDIFEMRDAGRRARADGREPDE
jgi:hypothetical protein